MVTDKLSDQFVMCKCYVQRESLHNNRFPSTVHRTIVLCHQFEYINDPT